MTTYNTGNPVGSVDVRDLYDNAQNLDDFSNGPLDAYPDRFGVSRQSLQGIRNASQYVDLGPYAAGLAFTSRNQVFSYMGEFYATGPSITLPYTTTGVGAAEVANFRSIGDAILRSDLTIDDDSVKGAALVGYKGRTVYDRLGDITSVKDFGAIGNGIDDDTATVQAAINGSPGRALYFPTGTYLCSTLSIPHSMVLLGEGANSVIKQIAGTNAHFIQPSVAGAQVYFRNLTLDQNNAGQTYGAGRFLFNSAQPGIAGSDLICQFEGVWFKDFCEGAARIVGDRSPLTREVMRIFNCRFTGGTESQEAVYNTFTVFAGDASELVICDSDFDHGLTLTKQGIPAISIAATTVVSAEYTECTIRNNRFAGYGRFSTGSGIGVIDAYVWADKVDISGNKFTDSYVSPIRAKCNARDVVISGNIMSNFQPSALNANGGISLVSSSNPPTGGRYIIQGNVIDAPLYRGIEVSDSAGVVGSVIVSDNIIKSPGDIGIYIFGCTDFAVKDNNIANSGQQGIGFSTCQGIGAINGNIINGTALAGIQAIGSQLALDLQVHGNFILGATASGVTIENIRELSLHDNTVKDVVFSGSQRGYRVGGSTGIAVGQIKNNLALGTFATGQFSIITAGFTEAMYERGNSWNYQERYLPAAPTSGTWTRGDIVWNTAPAAGGFIGWVCTTAGTPGAWKTFGAITA